MIKLKYPLEVFMEEYKKFISTDKYISVKDKETFLNNSKSIIKKMKGIIYSNNYEKCKQIIKDLNKNIIIHNDKFINNKLVEYKNYFDNLFKGIDDNVKLDDEQRRAILIDEDYTMIIAGAGSGKTTTMSAKVKYLVEKMNVDPHDILLISFTNQAVGELKERINKQFKIDCHICTFHKFGVDVMKNNTDNHLKVLVNSYSIIKKYFDEFIINDSEMLKNFIEFFNFYFDIPESAMKFKTLNDYINYKKRNDFETLKNRLSNYNENILNDRKKDYITARGETLKSTEEVMIANFLYLNNIEYNYEKPYPKLDKSKTYIPDFTIYYGEKIYYLEHFGINSKGYNKRYSKLDNYKYQKGIEHKRKLHHYYNTELIETYSEYSDQRSLIEHLEEELNKRNIYLKRKDDKEVYSMLVNTSKDMYYSRFIVFCLNFIQGFKTRGYTIEEFSRLKEENINDKRTTIFLNLIEKIYQYYQEELKKNNYIDFEDMINESYNLLNTLNEKANLNYKYIIIDEYQDISYSRFNLAKKVSQLSNAKVIAVGDDWQAIFSFSGSDVSLFTMFKDLMGYAEELQITHTYRNSQELIDIAGKFVMQNDFQIKKRLLSNKHLSKPVKLLAYDDYDKKLENKIKAVDLCIKDIIKNYGDYKRILIIGRYNFDKYKLINSEYFYELEEGKIKSLNFPNVDITFLTAHSSKGLGYDNVIIVNGENNTYGFPSKVKNDPIMDLIAVKNDNFKYSEERRLFYVALTRTKNNVYVVYPSSNPSEFIKEIKAYKNVLDIDLYKNKEYDIKCPKCKKYYLIKNNSNNLGINNLYVCSNEKELCGYMTNNLKYKRKITNCLICKTGLLIVKKNKNNNTYFIGCTNYDNGCNYTIKI